MNYCGNKKPSWDPMTIEWIDSWAWLFCSETLPLKGQYSQKGQNIPKKVKRSPSIPAPSLTLEVASAVHILTSDLPSNTFLLYVSMLHWGPFLGSFWSPLSKLFVCIFGFIAGMLSFAMVYWIFEMFKESSKCTIQNSTIIYIFVYLGNYAYGQKYRPK